MSLNLLLRILSINKECNVIILNIFLNDYDFASVVVDVNGFKECGTTLFYNYLVDNYKNPILSKKSVFIKKTWSFYVKLLLP